MSDIISLISSGITMTKGLFDIACEANDAILIKQISDLTIQLAQTQNKATELLTEIHELKKEQEENKNNPLTYNGLVYQGEDGFFYCPACFDSNKKRIHLKKFDTPHNTPCFNCPICKEAYEE